MYCIKTNMKPNIVRKNTVMVAAPVANAGTANSRTSRSG